MFSEAALQRDKDFKRIDRFTKLGYSLRIICFLYSRDEGRSYEEVALESVGSNPFAIN